MVCATEKLLPGPTAVEQVTGDRPHYSTYFRWTQIGLLAPDGRRIRLDFSKCGSRRKSSVEDVKRFFDRLTASQGDQLVADSRTTVTSTEQRDAERELALQGA